MQISQVSTISSNTKYHNLRKNGTSYEILKESQTSFKGLWGESKYSNESFSKFDDLLLLREKKFYYPFLDESNAEINELKSEYPKCRSGVYRYGLSGYSYQESAELYVKDRLPFSKNEWLQYIKNKFELKNNIRDLIEEYLKKFDLKHYLK